MEHNPNLNAASNFRTERTGHLINEYTTIHMPDALRKETIIPNAFEHHSTNTVKIKIGG